MFLMLETISDLTYGQAFGLATRPEYRWLANDIRDINLWKDLEKAIPWIFTSARSIWFNTNEWILRDCINKTKKVSGILDQHAKERSASPEKLIERIDIASTLMTAHDPKSGDKLSSPEVWEEVKMLMTTGEQHSIIPSNLSQRVTDGI